MSQTNGRNSISRLTEAIRKADIHWLLHLLKETEVTQTELDDALHTAAWTGQNESVRLLLAAGASLKSVSPHQEPLLVVAVYSGNVEVVRTILEAGYDILSVAIDSTRIPNPLHLAISSRGNPNYEMVDLLLEAGLDPECKDIDGDTPLIAACNMGDVILARKFLAMKAEVDASGYEGNRALHRAVEAESEELIQLLMDHKAKINAPNIHGNTPLMVACENGNASLLKTLIDKCSIDALQETNVEGKGCLHLAAIGGEIEVLDLLLGAKVFYEATDKCGNTPLILAAITKNKDFAMRLLDVMIVRKEGTRCITVQGELGRSALHWASIHNLFDLAERLIELSESASFVDSRDDAGDSALILAAKASSGDCVKLLINSSSDVNIGGELGRTALHWAAANGDSEAIDALLLAPGLDLNAVDQLNNTPLTLAALNCRTKELISLAEHGGSEMNAKGEQGRTVLHWLCQAGQASALSQLLSYSTASFDANVVDKNGDTALMLAVKSKQEAAAVVLLKYPMSQWLHSFDLDCVDAVGRQVLHYASSEGFVEIVRLLLANKIDVNRQDCDGCCALILAAKNRHESVIQALIESGCDVNVTDDEMRTPLYYAAHSGMLDAIGRLISARADPDLRRSEPSPLIQATKIGSAAIVRVLLAHGAEANYHDAQGRTALMWAAQGGHANIMSDLLAKGADARNEDASGDTALTLASWNGHPEAVKLLANISDLEHRERDEGMTALHLAIARDNREIVRTLLDAGSDANALDALGNNCLLTAMIHTSGSEIVSMILHQCPFLDVNFIGDQGRSALHWAVGDPECLKMVIERQPDVDLIDNNGASPILLAIAHSKPVSAEILIDAGADFRKMHRDGRAAIHHASIYGVTKVVELLLSRDVSADTPTEDGKMPLLLASVEGHVDIVRLLIKHQSELNRIYLDAMTPLTVAATGRHHQVMEVLLEAGADPNLFGSKKCSPLMTSILNNDLEGTALLIQHGAKLNQVIEEDKHPIHGAMVNNYVDILRLLVSVECDINFLRRLIREGIVYYFVDSNLFFEELLSLSKIPKPLKMLCRNAIRQRLTIPIREKIHRLPVPVIIQEYLAMKEISCQFMSSQSAEA